MLKLKKSTSAMLAAILSTGVLFGCASGEEEEPNTAEDTTEQEETETETEE
ncbi:hypothetical protein SAMN05877753_10168 [Bacillus oleivorans]|uniref:Uncharacterized protein n=1 Tax=Bacillus oleivorans TaxID=1448271 RepID=A0A285CGL4_9BACI|nr:hypothetical protein [Bacillus oleivorans]SNX66757.1 hypothetical protein SAMN05877753_10168 [Bacillus oleivorans]